MTTSLRQLVRVELDGESTWAEHIEGSIYRSLNATCSNVLLKIPGHKRDGMPCNLRWGDLFEAEILDEVWVKPTFIVGSDLSPRK